MGHIGAWNCCLEELVAGATQALARLPADELEALNDLQEGNLQSLEEVIRRKLDQASLLRQST